MQLPAAPAADRGPHAGGRGKLELERRRSRGMGLVAASAAALVVAVCGLASGPSGTRGAASEAGVTDRRARLSQLAMVSPGPPAGQEAFAFTVPAGLSAGQQFVVHVPGRRSQLELVSPGMSPGQRVQLSFAGAPLPQAAEETASLVDSERAPSPASGAQLPAPPSMLPALSPLPDWPHSASVAHHEAMLSQWHNRPNPVQDDDAAATALANWRPQQTWAQKRAADEHRERSMIAAKAQPTLSREVGALKRELAAANARLHAAAKREGVLHSKAHQWEKKFALEKTQLVKTWRQGEKELGAREEAEKQALRLRKEVLADQEKVGKLNVELASRRSDIALLQHELPSAGTVKGVHALREENKRLEAQVEADDTEMVHMKRELASKHAGVSSAELAKKKEEVSNLEKDLARMTHRDEVQAARLKDAKQSIWKMASGGSKLKQAALEIKREGNVEASQQKTIDALRKRLATVEAAGESTGQDSTVESRIEPRSEKAEVKDLKAKLAHVKTADAAKNIKLQREVEALQSQASDVKTALSKVVQYSDHHALKLVYREKKEVEKLQTSKKKEERTVSMLKKELDNKDKQLNDAREKAANAPVLQKELEKDDHSMHALWKKLSRTEAKLRSVQAKEEEREQLIAKVNALKEDLEAHRDLEIQSLKKQLAAKESELNAAREDTKEQIDHDAIVTATKADKAHVAVVLKDESALRKTLQNEKRREANLLVAKENQLEKDDKSMHKLKGELSRMEAKLHAEQVKEKKYSELPAKVSALQEEKSKLRKQLQSLKHKSVQLLNAQEGAEHAKTEEEEKASTIRSHYAVLAKEYKALSKQNAELKTAEDAAGKAKLAAEEEAKRALKEVDTAVKTRKTVSGDEAKLRTEERADSQKIGRLEGELEVNNDEESILQQKLTDTQAKLLLLQQGNQSNVSELQTKLETAQNQIKTLEGKLEDKVGDLAVEQDEVEEEKDNTGRGAAMREEEENVLRQKVHKMLKASADMTTKLGKEHDERRVAEEKVSELKKMVSEEQERLSQMKGKLWTSQVQVGRLRKQLNHHA